MEGYLLLKPQKFSKKFCFSSLFLNDRFVVEELYPNVNVSSIGKSIEGRDLNLVTINGGRNLPKIFIDAGIHAREWISPASTLFFMDKLTKVLKRLVIVSTILIKEIISCFRHLYNKTRQSYICSL